MTDEKIKSLRAWLKRGTGSEFQVRYELSLALDEIERLRAELKWIHDGAHTRGHTLPDIKARCHYALGMDKSE